MLEDLTEYHLPLIIICVRPRNNHLGVGDTVSFGWLAHRRYVMRVYVYKHENGTQSVLVEPTLGSGKTPILIHKVTRETIVGLVLPVVNSLRGGRKQDPAELLP